MALAVPIVNRGMAVLSGAAVLLLLLAVGPSEAVAGQHTWQYDANARVTVWTPPSDVSTSSQTAVQIWKQPKADIDYSRAQYTSWFSDSSPATRYLDTQLTTRSWCIPVGVPEGLGYGYNLVVLLNSSVVKEKHIVYIPPDRTLAVSVADTLPVTVANDTLPVTMDSTASVSIDSTLPVTVTGLGADGELGAEILSAVMVGVAFLSGYGFVKGVRG